MQAGVAGKRRQPPIACHRKIVGRGFFKIVNERRGEQRGVR